MTLGTKCPRCGLMQIPRLYLLCKACGAELDGPPQELNEHLEPQEKAKWYERKALVILLLFVFFPVGLYALWKNSKFSTKTKGILTAVVVILFMISISEDNGGVKRRVEAPPPDSRRTVAEDERHVSDRFGQTRDARSLQEQVQAEQRGAKALLSAIGDESGVISVTADSRRGVVIVLSGEMWRGLSLEQKQALAERYMGIVLRGNGNIAVPTEVQTEHGRVAFSMNHPVRMEILR